MIRGFRSAVHVHSVLTESVSEDTYSSWYNGPPLEATSSDAARSPGTDLDYELTNDPEADEAEESEDMTFNFTPGRKCCLNYINATDFLFLQDMRPETHQLHPAGNTL